MFIHTHTAIKLLVIFKCSFQKINIHGQPTCDFPKTKQKNHTRACTVKVHFNLFMIMQIRVVQIDSCINSDKLMCLKTKMIF